MSVRNMMDEMLVVSGASEGRQGLDRTARTLLLIDTCGALGSIALARVDAAPAVLGETSFPGRTTSECLLGSVRALLDTQGLALRHLDGVVVVNGPGSFTGLRIGMSFAKGLCEALGLPLVPVSRLGVLAQFGSGRVLAVLDAGRGQLYCGEYRDAVCLSERLLTGDSVRKLTDTGAFDRFVTSEEEVVSALAPAPVVLVPELTAADALAIAARRFQDGSFADVAAADANYVRRSGAELFAKSPSPVSNRI